MKSIYLIISGLCAVATVLLGYVQTFGVPGFGIAGPAQVQAAPDPTQAQPKAEMTVAKVDIAATAADQVAPTLRFGRGTRDGVVDRYPIGDLFDGNPATYIETRPGDRDLDFIAEFDGASPRKVTGLEYRHPGAAGSDAVATQLDMIVLPEGGMEASGREVRSFTLAPEKGPQRFDIPGIQGKGVWLRIAGQQSEADLMVGDMRLITSAQ